MASNTEKIFDYIFNLTKPGVKLDLGRVRSFFNFLGNPYLNYPVVHLAGTNGKGSTAVMLANVLKTSGMRTGLFTSPHLVVPNERIRVNDRMIPDEEIIKNVSAWKHEIEKYGITFFEVLTTLAMVHFDREKVDYAVIETGLGGRLDSTNVVIPEISIITSISFDHMNILGNTLELIAREKAGIIKRGKPVILSRNSSQIQNIISEIAERMESPFIYVPDYCQLVHQEYQGLRQHLHYRTEKNDYHLELALIGRHQVENLATVLTAVELLGIATDENSLSRGLSDLHWGGRMQIVNNDPMVIYDVAHNPSGLRMLLDSLEDINLSHAVLIAGFNARKDIPAMLETLSRWQGPLAFYDFRGHSALDPSVLMELGISTEIIFSDIATVYRWAREQNPDAICFFGSHYLAEEIYNLFQNPLSDFD